MKHTDMLKIRRNMLKNKIIALCLCVCLLASTVLLFTSCGKKTIDLTNEYTVVYGSDLSTTATNEVKDFIKTLENQSGQEIYLQKVATDDAVEGEDDYEILVGNTNRAETAKALKKIKGYGYSITKIGKKIVIVGTTNFLTCLALDQFRQSLTGQAGPSTLEITEYRADRLEMLELSSEWRFVYSSLLRGEGDYVNEAIAKLCGQLPDLLGDKKFNIPSITDNESANLEILAGLVERAETKSLLGSMDADNYAVSARNGKLIVTAHNDDTMRMAFSLFTDILSDSVIVTEGGEKQIVLPADFTRIYTDKKTDYITDFPRPEGLALSGTINVHDGSFEYYYEGEGVNANAYDQYCKKLVSDTTRPIVGVSTKTGVFPFARPSISRLMSIIADDVKCATGNSPLTNLMSASVISPNELPKLGRTGTPESA